MWRLALSPKTLVIALVVGTILTLCSLLSIGHEPLRIDAISCSSSCSPHTPAIAAAPTFEEQDQDKEPMPPMLYWLLPVSALTYLYMTPASRRKTPLINNLRQLLVLANFRS